MVSPTRITPETWRSHLTSDYRAGDYPDDAHLWVRLLNNAYDIDGDVPDGLFGALVGCRAFGCRLDAIGTGVHLVAGELGTDYAEIRQLWLVPHADVLRQLLRGLRH